MTAAAAAGRSTQAEGSGVGRHLRRRCRRCVTSIRSAESLRIIIIAPDAGAAASTAWAAWLPRGLHCHCSPGRRRSVTSVSESVTLAASAARQGAQQTARGLGLVTPLVNVTVYSLGPESSTGTPPHLPPSEPQYSQLTVLTGRDPESPHWWTVDPIVAHTTNGCCTTAPPRPPPPAGPARPLARPPAARPPAARLPARRAPPSRPTAPPSASRPVRPVRPPARPTSHPLRSAAVGRRPPAEAAEPSSPVRPPSRRRPHIIRNTGLNLAAVLAAELGG